MAKFKFGCLFLTCTAYNNEMGNCIMILDTIVPIGRDKEPNEGKTSFNSNWRCDLNFVNRWKPFLNLHKHEKLILIFSKSFLLSPFRIKIRNSALNKFSYIGQFVQFATKSENLERAN